MLQKGIHPNKHPYSSHTVSAGERKNKAGNTHAQVLRCLRQQLQISTGITAALDSSAA